MMRYGMLLCIALLAAGPAHSDQSAIEAADFDGSGRVDFADFLIFAAGFGRSLGEEGFDARLDLNGDGVVDFLDFLIFAQHFGKSVSDPPHEFLYIADLARNRVEVVDRATNLSDPDRAIPVVLPRGLAVSRAHRRLYVAGLDTFYAFSETGSSVFKTPYARPFALPETPVESAGGFRVALNPRHDLAFVTLETAAGVEVFDALSGAFKTRVSVPPTPNGIAFDPGGQRVYVAHGVGAATLSILDAGSPALIDSISVPHPVCRVVVSPDGERLYLNNRHGGDLLVVNPRTGAVVETLSLAEDTDLDAGLVDLALTADGSRLAVTLNRIWVDGSLGFDVAALWGGLVVLDTATWEKTRIPIGDVVANLGVSPDGATAYVAGMETLSGETPGTLQVFIVDLDEALSLGAIRGLALPVAFAFRAGKPVLPGNLPEMVVF